MTLPLFPLYRRISLSKGQFTIVDEADYEWVMQWKWCATLNPGNNAWYAMRSTKVAGKNQTIRLHRLLMGIQRGNKLQVAHINHDTLDNRRENLRVCTASQNQFNTRGQVDSKSGYKGVFFSSSHRRWVAKISVNGKKHHLGYGSTPEECAALYREAAKHLHGEFACTESNGLTRCATVSV